MTSNSQNNRVYNVTLDGFGYVNRIREVTPPNGETFLACDVALLQGAGDNVTHARFNCAIRGDSAIDLVRAHFTGPRGRVVHPENTTVVARMVLDGISARNFVYGKGEKKGQKGIALHSNLLIFRWLKIGTSIIDVDPTPMVQPAETSAEDSGGNDGKPKWDFQSLPSTSEKHARLKRQSGFDVFDRKLSKSSRWWPMFAGKLSDQYRDNGYIVLKPQHTQFEAQKTFLIEQEFIYDCRGDCWIRKTDQEYPVDSVTNEVLFDLRHMDFKNNAKSPICLEGSTEDTIGIYLNGQFLGETETMWDQDEKVFFWVVVLEHDPRGELEIRDPDAIVDETRRWAETHPNPQVEKFALPD